MFCSSLHHNFTDFGQCKKIKATKRVNGLMLSSYVSLSPEEQDLVDRDLYGTNEPIDETEDLINAKLKELQEEVDLLPDHIKRIYNIAVNIEKKQGTNPKYVESREFHLMFLRSELFDARLAAKRLTRHFSEKLDTFGEETLARKIKLSDLNKYDMALCNSGAICITGATDRAGRLLFFCHIPEILKLQAYPINIKRCIFYMLQNALEKNEDSQRKGIVIVTANFGIHPVLNFARIRKFLSAPKMVYHSLPVRIVGNHRCYDDIKVHLAFNLLLVVMPKHIRSKVQCHYANPSEHGGHEWCLHELLAYGIDPDDLPVTTEGNIRAKMACDALKWHLQLENGNESRNTVLNDDG